MILPGSSEICSSSSSSWTGACVVLAGGSACWCTQVGAGPNFSASAASAEPDHTLAAPASNTARTIRIENPLFGKRMFGDKLLRRNRSLTAARRSTAHSDAKKE